MGRSYNIPLVLQTADRIEDEQVRCYVGTTLEKDQFHAFVNLVRQRLPPDISKRVVQDSLLYLAGRELTAEELSTLAWRLAGNVGRMRQHRLATPWTHQEYDEWVPLQIIRENPDRDRHDRAGSWLDFRVLAGSPCPQILTKFWTCKFMSLLASHFGFSRPWGEYPYEEPAELVGMRLMGLIEADLSQHKPAFEQLRIVPSMLDFNRKLLRDRTRPPGGFVCPQAFTHPCYQCPVGYADCPVAVHPRTYRKRLCRQCQQQAWFDPARPKQRICVSCYARAALRPRTKPQEPT